MGEIINKMIVFAGPSGIGKSTLAKKLSDETGFKYISGSVSDLIPATKDLSHRDMLDRNHDQLFQEDYQVLNLRNKLFSKYKDKGYISDRSFLDVAAYCIYKQASKLPTCELTDFLALAKDLTTKNCSHVVLLDYPVDFIGNWKIQDNGKRILHDFFQCNISKLMRLVLEYWSVTLINNVRLIYPPKTEIGVIRGEKGKILTRILVLGSDNLEERFNAICNFIKDEEDL